MPARAGGMRVVVNTIACCTSALIPSLPVFLPSPAGVPLEPSSSGGALTAQAPSSEQALVVMTTVNIHNTYVRAYKHALPSHTPAVTAVAISDSLAKELREMLQSSMQARERAETEKTVRPTPNALPSPY